MRKKSIRTALMLALGEVGYIFLVALFFLNMEKYFGDQPDPPAPFGIVIILTLLVISAAVSAPLQMDLETIRLFSIAKLGWIRKQQARLRNQKRETAREYITRESHYYLGQRYLLKVIPRNAAPEVVLKHDIIELYVRPGAKKKQKEELLQMWYRQQLKETVVMLVEKLEKKLNVKVADVAVRTMKTKWGTCNIKAKRIWLNTELAKKPIENIEYVLIHEMTHLLERKHNESFIAYLDKFLPKWKHLREELNRSALGHVEWSY